MVHLISRCQWQQGGVKIWKCWWVTEKIDFWFTLKVLSSWKVWRQQYGVSSLLPHLLTCSPVYTVHLPHPRTLLIFCVHLSHPRNPHLHSCPRPYQLIQNLFLKESNYENTQRQKHSHHRTFPTIGVRTGPPAFQIRIKGKISKTPVTEKRSLHGQ